MGSIEACWETFQCQNTPQKSSAALDALHSSGHIVAGIASSTAELYARFDIPSIPLGSNKRPAVRGFKIASLTVDQSRAYMRRRPDADALGVPDGRLSGLVRVDIDEPGDDVVAKVIRRAGDTPAKVRTASGKMHLVYADNGERRLTGAPGKANARPWDDIKADLCGAGGYSISPPSRTNGGEYELLGDFTLEQLLENRHRLPTIRGLEPRAYLIPQAQPAPADDIQAEIGTASPWSTDADLYPAVARICQRVHRTGGTKDDAMHEAARYDAGFQFPLGESAVTKKVNYCWDMTVAGKNRFGTGQRPHTVGWEERLAGDDPPLHALMTFLRKRNGADAEFKIANGLIGTHLTGWWSTDRLRDTRQRALEGKWIEMIVKAAQGRHALYRWGPTAMATIFA